MAACTSFGSAPTQWHRHVGL